MLIMETPNLLDLKEQIKDLKSQLSQIDEYQREAEDNIIGSIFTELTKSQGARPESLDKIDYLTAEDFTGTTARQIYSYVLSDTSKSGTIDLGDQTRYTGEILSYINSCMKLVITSANVPLYAQRLRDNTKKRKLIAAAADLIESLINRGDVDQELNNFQKRAEKALTVSVSAAEIENYKSKSNAVYLQQFADGIADGVNTPPIKTGFSSLDAALDGGLYEGLYILGALTSLGKTTFTMQIADQIAQQGQDVIIVALEMARNELIAKSISRLTYQICLEKSIDLHTAKSVRGITDGTRYGKYSKTESQTILEALKRYSSYAEHITVYEGVGDIGVNEVRSYVAKHKTMTGKAPVLVLDYLQILAPYNERLTDKQNTDKSIIELKRLSRDFKTPVVVISALNRQNYTEEINLSALRESSAIEYGSDVVLGLQLTSKKDKESIEEAKRQKTRDVEICVLKNRNGQTGGKVEYRYRTLFNCFEEVEN